MKTQRRFYIIMTLVLLLLLSLLWFSTHRQRPEREHAVFVQTEKVVQKSMPIILTAIGNIESEQSVAITPQVSGKIKNILFKEGEEVKAGQLLFELDPETYTASVAQATANMARDQADLEAKIADASRYAALVKLEFVTKQQYDLAQAAAKAQAAVVAADKAALQQTQIQLNYTKITAPMSGKTGAISVKIGDLVNAFSTTALVTINQLDPVWVNFSIPQSQLPTLLYYQHKAPLQVDVYNEDKSRLLGKGPLNFIDNTVNAQTGSVLIKAELPNPNRILWPGLMITVKIILTIQANAIVIPMSALQLDQQGHFVYRVVDGKAVVTRVTIDRQLENLAVISQGLKTSEDVITVIPPDLADGSVVNVNTPKINMNPKRHKHEYL